MSFKPAAYTDLKFNPYTMIAQNWWLITAGTEQTGFNTMTASWGQLGSLWSRPETKRFTGLPTAIVFVRPQRYTKEFLDREKIFSLTCFDTIRWRKALMYLGTHSGRDEDKIKTMGLTPEFGYGTTYFSEASLVFICKKIYQYPMQASGFVEPELLSRNYPDGDLHEMYIGEITQVLQKV